MAGRAVNPGFLLATDVAFTSLDQLIQIVPDALTAYGLVGPQPKPASVVALVPCDGRQS
jgi:hypothetical protein